MTSSSVLPYPEAVVTVAQRKALRPQSWLLLSVPLDVPVDPAAHWIGGPFPCLNHFCTGRGRLDAMPLHVVCNLCVVACHSAVQFCLARSRSQRSTQSPQTTLPSRRMNTSSLKRSQLPQRKPFSRLGSTSAGFIFATSLVAASSLRRLFAPSLPGCGTWSKSPRCS